MFNFFQKKSIGLDIKNRESSSRFYKTFKSYPQIES